MDLRVVLKGADIVWLVIGVSGICWMLGMSISFFVMGVIAICYCVRSPYFWNRCFFVRY